MTHRSAVLRTLVALGALLVFGALAGAPAMGATVVNLVGDEDNFGFGASELPCAFFDNASGPDIIAGAKVFDVVPFAPASWSHTFDPSGVVSAQLVVSEFLTDHNLSTITIDGVTTQFAPSGSECYGYGYRIFPVPLSALADGVVNVGVDPHGDAFALDWSKLVLTTTDPPCDPALSPAGCWRLGESSGTTAVDSSPNHNDGTYLNGVALGVAGVVSGDGAARLDGVNDQVRVPDSASLDVGDSFSVEAWIKRSSTAKTHEIMNKGTAGLQVVVMNGGSGNQVWLRKAGITTIARSSNGVPADARYHHVVVTKDGIASARIYIDGADVTVPVSLVQLIQNTTSPFTFGSGASTSADYDELALYDRALTAAEVGARFARGTP